MHTNRSALLLLLTTLLLLLTTTACSGGGGGAPVSDITIASRFEGSWMITTTVVDSTCGEAPGTTGEAFVRFVPDAGSAAVRVLDGDGVFVGAVQAGLLRAARAQTGGQISVELRIAGDDLVGSARETRDDGCVTNYTIRAARVPFAGTWTMFVTGTVSASTDLVVGSNLEIDVQIDPLDTSTDFEATMLNGYLAEAQFTSTSGGITGAATADYDGFELRLLLDGFDEDGDLRCELQRIAGNGDTDVLEGRLVKREPVPAVTGAWTFDFGGGQLIAGTLFQRDGALFLDTGAATTRMSGAVGASGDIAIWRGVGSFTDSDLPEFKFGGNFTGDAFSGGWENGNPLTGVRTGESTGGGGGQGGGGGSDCVTAQPGTWSLEVPGQLAFPNGTLTQNGCALVYSYSQSGINFTLAGDADGQAWQPTVTGDLLGSLSNVQVTFAGDGASFSGTANLGGNAVTISGARQ